MSRRKQKFPFQIAGEGDAVDCQELKKNVAAQVEEIYNSNSLSSAEGETTSDASELNKFTEGCDNQMNCFVVGYSGNEIGHSHNDRANFDKETKILPQVSTTLNGHQLTVKMDNLQPYYSIAKGTSEANLCAKKSSINCANVTVTESHKPINAVMNGINARCSRNDGISFVNSFHKLNNQNLKYSHDDGNPIYTIKSKQNEFENLKVVKTDPPTFICPVCHENFKSKRSFNSHILIHCQLVKGQNAGSKRSISESSHEESPSKKLFDGSSIEENHLNYRYTGKMDMWDSTLPLDLSCKNQEIIIDHSISSPLSYKKDNRCSKSSSFSSLRETISSEVLQDDSQAMVQLFDQSSDSKNKSVLSERSPMEDENENLVNEAREHEKAFFESSQNEHFLSEDSTGLEPPPPLPMVSSGGVTRKIKVCSDDGPPMVYSIKFHAEQIFASRILGVNEETGDKIELYKCFLCNFSFPSVSRLQAHLLIHKQRFVCRKCNISCDSRIQFSQHVQKEHVTKETLREANRLQNDTSIDTNNAENTVTVAALLSALHGNSFERKGFASDEENDRRTSVMNQEEEEEVKSEESFPASPSSEIHLEGMSENMETSSGVTKGEGDMFKMFSCRFCGKKFDRAFSCNRHERVHTGYKPCFCRICGRGFSEPRNLRHHVIRFHSDGSLRHLIKRDRRKRKEEDSFSQHSPLEYPSKDVLRECGNKDEEHPLIGNFVLNRQENTNSCSNGNLVVTYSTVNNNNNDNGRISNNFTRQDPAVLSQAESLNNYTSNLTKIFAASLDNSRPKKSESITSLNETKDPVNIVETTVLNKDIFHISEHNDSMDQLEPGEIRLNLKTKVINDGERGRRLVIADDSEDGSDHSPQFSSYAPRLNIVQEPVKRETLMPITDDIGRTFYECPYCLKLFGSTSDLNRHLDFHEDLRPYDCKYCEYSARTNSQLKVHKMRHEGIKQFSCDVCNYNGVTQSDLNRHKKTQSHIARSQNVCSMCGLGFYSASQKQIHIAKCHPEMEGASSLIQMSLGIPHSSLSNNSLPGFLESSDIPSKSTKANVDSSELNNESPCASLETICSAKGIDIEDMSVLPQPLKKIVPLESNSLPENEFKIDLPSEDFSIAI